MRCGRVVSLCNQHIRHSSDIFCTAQRIRRSFWSPLSPEPSLKEERDRDDNEVVVVVVDENDDDDDNGHDDEEGEGMSTTDSVD